MPGADIWPTELRLSPGGAILHVAFEAGHAFDLAAEYLRVMSPSAEVQGHHAGERKTLGGKRHVAIIGIEPVGTYAVRLRFDDMHDTGIYTWAILHDLGRNRTARWAAYVDELATKKLSRDLPGQA